MNNSQSDSPPDSPPDSDHTLIAGDVKTKFQDIMQVYNSSNLPLPIQHALWQINYSTISDIFEEYSVYLFRRYSHCKKDDLKTYQNLKGYISNVADFESELDFLNNYILGKSKYITKIFLDFYFDEQQLRNLQNNPSFDDLSDPNFVIWYRENINQRVEETIECTLPKYNITSQVIYLLEKTDYTLDLLKRDLLYNVTILPHNDAFEKEEQFPCLNFIGDSAFYYNNNIITEVQPTSVSEWGISYYTNDSTIQREIWYIYDKNRQWNLRQERKKKFTIVK